MKDKTVKALVFGYTKSIHTDVKKILTYSRGSQKRTYRLSELCIKLGENMECLEKLKSGWNLLLKKNKEIFIYSVNNHVIKIEHKNIFKKIVSYEILFHGTSVETILDFGDI